MQTFVGYVLILVGLFSVILAILNWLGIIKTRSGIKTLGEANLYDVLLELVKKLPWVAILGLLLIYAGLKMIGVNLPV